MTHHKWVTSEFNPDELHVPDQRSGWCGIWEQTAIGQEDREGLAFCSAFLEQESNAFPNFFQLE